MSEIPLYYRRLAIDIAIADKVPVNIYVTDSKIIHLHLGLQEIWHSKSADECRIIGTAYPVLEEREDG